MKIILVHRWDGTPDSDWYPWLKKELEKKGHHVIVPAMPNTSEPEITAWVGHLQKIVGKPDEQTYFFGHSIGCQTIMRYLATLPKGTKIGEVVFVAGWLKLRNLEDETAEQIAQPWLKTPIDFSAIQEKAKSITVFLSDNDQYVPLQENKNLFEQKLNAKVVIVRNKGHFTAEDGITTLPEILQIVE